MLLFTFIRPAGKAWHGPHPHLFARADSKHFRLSHQSCIVMSVVLKQESCAGRWGRLYGLNWCLKNPSGGSCFCSFWSSVYKYNIRRMKQKICWWQLQLKRFTNPTYVCKVDQLLAPLLCSKNVLGLNLSSGVFVHRVCRFSPFMFRFSPSTLSTIRVCGIRMEHKLPLIFLLFLVGVFLCFEK